jgi:hypothetical protein
MEMMIKFIEIIFEKAIAEHNFCKIYSGLILRLSDKSSLENKTKTFKKEFCRYCQNQYKLITAITEFKNSDEKTKFHRRVKGILYLFVGLYQDGILTATIIKECCLDYYLNLSIKYPESSAPENFCVMVKNLSRMESPKSINKCNILEGLKIPPNKSDSYVSNLKDIKEKVTQHHDMRIVFLIEDTIKIFELFQNKN